MATVATTWSYTVPHSLNVMSASGIKLQVIQQIIIASKGNATDVECEAMSWRCAVSQSSYSSNWAGSTGYSQESSWASVPRCSLLTTSCFPLPVAEWCATYHENWPARQLSVASAGGGWLCSSHVFSSTTFFPSKLLTEGTFSAEERWREAEGTVSLSSLPDTINFRMQFCHSTGIARSGGGVIGVTLYLFGSAWAPPAPMFSWAPTMLWRKWAKSDVKSVFRSVLMVPWASFPLSAPPISFQKLQPWVGPGPA